MAEVEAVLRSLDEELGRRRARYQQYVTRIRDLPGIQRAEKWLEYAVGDGREDGDEEASIYFLSRGRPELANIEAFIADWKRGSQHVLDEVNKTDVIYTERGIKRGKPKPK